MGPDQGMSPYSVLKVNIYLNNFSTTFATRAPRRNSCDPCGGHREPLLYASACAYMYMQAPCIVLSIYQNAKLALARL